MDCSHSVLSERSPDRNVAEGIAVKKEIPITLLILILCAAPGCSRFRQLTRRDYATLSDPFVDKSALTADAAAAEAAPAASGIARLNGNPPASASNTQTALAASQSPATSGTPATSKPTGPALSDFVGQTAKTAPTPQTPSPSQTVAVSSSSPVSDSDMARLGGQFPQQPSSNPTASVVRDSGFAEWANSRKSEWEKQVAEAESVGKATAASGIQQVGQTVSQAADAAFAELPEPVQAMVQNRESATPLITQQPAAQRPVATQAAPPADLDGFQNFAAQANANTRGLPAAPPPREAFSNQAAATNSAPAAAASPPPAFASRTRLPGTQFNAEQSSNAWPAEAAQIAPKTSPPAFTPNSPDPFAAFENSNQSQPSANASVDPFADADPFAESPPASPRTQTLDSGFNFDSGWKPSHLERP